MFSFSFLPGDLFEFSNADGASLAHDEEEFWRHISDDERVEDAV
jgi:hypothetical protein